MFAKIIKVKNRSDIIYGRTEISYNRTYTEIMDLLKKHGCDRIAFMEDAGQQIIVFEYEGHTYRLGIPRVYINNVYNDRIGIRLIRHYLKPLLELVKIRVIDFGDALLGSRLLSLPEGGSITYGEALEQVEPAQFFNDVIRVPQLKAKDREDI